MYQSTLSHERVSIVIEADDTAVQNVGEFLLLCKKN